MTPDTSASNLPDHYMLQGFSYTYVVNLELETNCTTTVLLQYYFSTTSQVVQYYNSRTVLL